MPPPSPYALPPYAPPRPNNGMAIASMVLGILWINGIGSILALVFGYIAKRQIAERNEQGAGFATAGIVLGWVGIGALVLVVIIAIIVGLSDSSTSWE
ncbi:MAG: DUF4190 domain-containing protein [Actinomycetota bacterium]|nr:DUF4190 domain-containing protein [Actinomycetota bacterium]